MCARLCPAWRRAREVGKVTGLGHPESVAWDAAGGKLFVTDTMANRVYQIEPADFLGAEPQVSVVLERAGLAPNGIWAEADGSLLIASSPRDGSLGPLYRLAHGAREAQAITKPLGRLDGLAVLNDGTIVFSDWVTGSIYALKPGGEPQKLAEGFTGPADFCLILQGAGYRMLAPDLVKGEVRVFDLAP